MLHKNNILTIKVGVVRIKMFELFEVKKKNNDRLQILGCLSKNCAHDKQDDQNAS